jgi:hypothetical protein
MQEKVSRLAPCKTRVGQYRVVDVAQANEKLTLGVNSGPGLPATNSMPVAVPNARAAILNYGRVGRDIAAGNLFDMQDHFLYPEPM